MYHAHSKDINRNKSFHPLTYANLRRVEQLKEKQEQQQRTREERAKELRRDQEERRYDELVLGATTSATGTTSAQLAHFRQVKNVFAAEYATPARSNERDDGGSSGSGNAVTTTTTRTTSAMTSTTSAPVVACAPPPAIALKYSLADKFHMDSDTSLKAEGAARAVDDSDDKKAVAATAHVGVKRERDDVRDITRAAHTACNNNNHATTTTTAAAAAQQTTGYVSSSEAARLRKELDLVKKQRLDPLRRVQQFHNSAVAAAARTQAQQQQQRHTAAHPSATTDTQASLKDHIKRMLNM